ncbi:MAG: lysophospholipid acyltransferase family protein [Rikenellaceae bacterium]
MKSRRRLNIVERRMLRILWSWVVHLANLPHEMQFQRVAPIIKFILYRVLLYRVGTVRRNLRRSFPEKSRAERRRIRDDYYTYLSETIISTIALARKSSYNTIFDDEHHAPHNREAAELCERIEDRSWIALTAHFGLWEYLLYWSQFSNQKLLGVYHPLSNRLFDTLFKLLRRKQNVLAIPTHNVGRFIMTHGHRHKGESYTLGLIADQNPPPMRNYNWYEFLNQPTVFFEGGEKFAMKFGLPIYFIYQRRIAAGRYQFCATALWDGTEQVTPTQITARYVRMLEDLIRQDPSIWLWSHRRWKYRRTEGNSINVDLIR